MKRFIIPILIVIPGVGDFSVSVVDILVTLLLWLVGFKAERILTEYVNVVNCVDLCLK